ncbi:S8 family serine peptidase [Halovenus salina]|uniref:S8 family serine peptidase n=1 Tax=Halovenus salina TaxID=1510225 RepID=A0ABD5W032_9EURY
MQSGHGTAVGGVIAGGTNDDGKRYGIAPEVNLYVAQQVSKPPEGVRLLSVIAGIQWAIEQDVDVLSMSFGNPGYNHAYVEPVQNALDSGIFVVAGLGNSGPATGFSPANIPGVVAAGNIDDEREVNSSSSGEHIETERYWGDDAPEEWPDEYTLPDVTAPGTNIPSAAPNGEFVSDKSGTSYSCPCIAAVAALAIAATDADNEAIREAMFETARHPAAKDDFDVDPGHDDRHGRGIVSALATISRLRASETLSGTVTDDSGTPLSGVTVASETGLQTQTDSQGQYELTLPPITQPVGALGVGFETAGTSFNPAETDTQSFELARTDEFDVEMTERMLTHIDPGQTATATFDAANVEALTVELNERGPFDPGWNSGSTTHRLQLANQSPSIRTAPKSPSASLSPMRRSPPDFALGTSSRVAIPRSTVRATWFTPTPTHGSFPRRTHRICSCRST